jgi:hypothetical protein
MHVFERQHVRVTPRDYVRHLELMDVRVDAEGVWLDKRLVLERDDIVSVVLTLGERTTVQVQSRKGARFDLARGFGCTFTDPADVEAMLVALGRDPAKTRTEVELEPSLLTFGFRDLPLWKAGLATLAAIVVLVVSIPLLVRPTSARGLSLEGLLARQLDIGADGLHVRMAFTKDFLPYAAIASVSARHDAVVLTLRDGQEVVLRPTVGARVAEIVALIRRAAPGAGSADAQEHARVLDVSGTKAEQVAALRELGKRSTDYRAGELPRERLWDLVEDPAVDGPVRARAAIALSADLPADERARLRVAADGTVQPKVRIALDAAEHESADRLAEILHDVDEEAPRSRRHLSMESASS